MHASLKSAKSSRVSAHIGGGGVTEGTRSLDLGPRPLVRGPINKKKVLENLGPNPHTTAPISLGRDSCQLGGFLVGVVIVALFVPTVCPHGGGGYVGYTWKALEKGYLEHPGLHTVLTICVRFSSVSECACVARCLLLSTGS